ncbi:unnamed protein product [Mytilus coruscus]|uniref:C-type lectin domain-containing protein n=1 Tax=Mytilus coruscus TaxID=42192 RepID=A0A6J8EAV4_MYTCO|nr:unnamed protein product [Mytilus coruscus]
MTNHINLHILLEDLKQCNLKLHHRIVSEFCRTYNSYLATIETGGENSFLTDTIELLKNGIGKRDIDDRDFWLGGTDEVIEGVWVWAATGKDFTYTNWFPGDPDNWKTGENCLELTWLDGIPGKWNDQDCSFVSHFICEMDQQGILNMSNSEEDSKSAIRYHEQKKTHNLMFKTHTVMTNFKLKTTTETGKSAIRYHKQKKTQNNMSKTNTGYDQFQAQNNHKNS